MHMNKKKTSQKRKPSLSPLGKSLIEIKKILICIGHHPPIANHFSRTDFFSHLFRLFFCFWIEKSPRLQRSLIVKMFVMQQCLHIQILLVLICTRPSAFFLLQSKSSLAFMLKMLQAPSFCYHIHYTYTHTHPHKTNQLTFKPFFTF